MRDISYIPQRSIIRISEFCALASETVIAKIATGKMYFSIKFSHKGKAGNLISLVRLPNVFVDFISGAAQLFIQQDFVSVAFRLCRRAF